MNDNFNAGGIEMVDKLLYAANTDAGRREEGPVARKIRERKVAKLKRRIRKHGGA